MLTLLTQNSVDDSVSLQVTMAFKDAQLKLLEETKKVSSFEFCSSLKQSFSAVKPHVITFGAPGATVQSARGPMKTSLHL